MGPLAPAMSGREMPDKAVRQQLSRILASKTFPQVDRLKRFVSFIVGETVGGRGRAEGIRHRRPGLRQGALVRSAHRPDRPRAGRRLRARLVRYYREEGHSDASIIDLPKGGYAPVFKTATKRRPAAVADGDAGRPNTVAVLPFRRSTARAEPRLLLPRPARRDRSRADVDQGAARAAAAPTRDRRRRQRARRCGAGDHRRRAIGRRSRARHRASRRRRERPLPVVRVGGRRARDDPFARRKRSRRRSPTSSSPRSMATRSGRAPPARTSRRAISTCRAAITSTSAPKRACTRRSSSSRRRSSRTRSSRSRTAAWPTRYGLLAHYGVLGPRWSGRRRRRARRRR